MCLQSFPVMIIICFFSCVLHQYSVCDKPISWFPENLFFFDAGRWTAPCRWCAWERSATSPGCSSCVMTWSPWKHWCMRRRATWASRWRSCSSSATSTSSTCWWRMWVLFFYPLFESLGGGMFFFLVVVVGFKICGFTIIFSPIFKFSKHSLLTSKLSPSADVAASAPSKLESDQPNIIIAERSSLRMNHLNSFFHILYYMGCLIQIPLGWAFFLRFILFYVLHASNSDAASKWHCCTKYSCTSSTLLSLKLRPVSLLSLRERGVDSKHGKKPWNRCAFISRSSANPRSWVWRRNNLMHLRFMFQRVLLNLWIFEGHCKTLT